MVTCRGQSRLLKQTTRKFLQHPTSSESSTSRSITAITPTASSASIKMFARQIPRSSPCVNAARAFSTSTPNRFAKINIIGNLADAPELIATSTGREVIKYAVASSHGPKDNRKTSWWRVSAFLEGPQRDRVMSLTKG